MNKQIMLVVSHEEWEFFRQRQEEILKEIQELKLKGNAEIPIKYITAKEFMAAVRMSRSKFDQLVAANKIKTIKKGRKIYVPAGEIERYFADHSI